MPGIAAQSVVVLGDVGVSWLDTGCSPTRGTVPELAVRDTSYVHDAGVTKVPDQLSELQPCSSLSNFRIVSATESMTWSVDSFTLSGDQGKEYE